MKERGGDVIPFPSPQKVRRDVIGIFSLFLLPIDWQQGKGEKENKSDVTPLLLYIRNETIDDTHTTRHTHTHTKGEGGG